MHTALIAAAVTAGLVAAGAATNPATQRPAQGQAACVEKVSSYPASIQPGVACGTSYTGYLGASIDRR